MVNKDDYKRRDVVNEHSG